MLEASTAVQQMDLRRIYVCDNACSICKVSSISENSNRGLKLKLTTAYGSSKTITLRLTDDGL
jgi:hypothetical protein